MTVFFTLIVSVILTFILGMIYGVRENAIRLKVKQSADVSMRSSFAEYERILWERYNLLFVDIGYGFDVDSFLAIEDHYTEFMNNNFDEMTFRLLGGVDLLKLDCKETQTQAVRFATDNNGEAIRKQAIKAMKYKYGVGFIEDFLEHYQSARDNNLLDATGNEMAIEAIERLEEESSPVLQEIEAASREAIFGETNVSTFSTLKKVVRDISSISRTTIDVNSLLEKRSINQGNSEASGESGLTDNLIFYEYVLTYMGNYVSKKPDTALTYECEYLIRGKKSDIENLEGVVNRLLLIREASNLMTLLSDENRMNEIEALATGIAYILQNPELSTVIETVIASLWSYAESKCDVSVLLDGGKVPLIKTSSEWKTTMANIFTRRRESEGYEYGMGYRDYLRLFLYLEGADTVTKRMMNLLELNVRKEQGRKTFNLDNCIDRWKIKAYVSSEYGYDYIVEREIDLEK